MEKENLIWLKYVPEDIQLYFIDYDCNLNEQTSAIQKAIEDNSLYPIYECISDSLIGCEYPYLEEIEKAMDEDGLHSEYIDNEDDIRDYLRDVDSSTPEEDLIRNTYNINAYYTLGEVDYMRPGKDNTKRIESSISHVIELLGIDNNHDNYSIVKDMVEESYDGGELRIYFRMKNIADFIYSENNKSDFDTISFDGEFVVAIYDSAVGSGDFSLFDLNHSFRFLRKDLNLSEGDCYNAEDCFGVLHDWCDTEGIVKLN